MSERGRSGSTVARTAKGVANLYLLRRGEVIVVVEGRKDRPFWRWVFPAQYRGFPVTIAPTGTGTGGVQEALKVLERIRNGLTKGTVVAIDSEYDDLLHDKPKDRLLVKTRRHSIENYLYDPIVLDEVLTLCCYLPAREGDYAERWLEQLAAVFEEMLYADFTAIRLNTGTEVMGQRADPFLADRGHLPSEDKIASRLTSLSLDTAEIDKTRRLFAGRTLYHYIRGHFLTGCIRRRLEHEVAARTRNRMRSMSNDELFKDCLNKLAQHWKLIPDAVRLRDRARRALHQLADAR